MDDLPEPVNEETMVTPEVPAAIEEDVALPAPEPAAAMPEPESSAPNALTTFMAEWNAKLQAKIGAEQDAEKADRAKAKEEMEQWKKQVRSFAGDPDVCLPAPNTSPNPRNPSRNRETFGSRARTR